MLIIRTKTCLFHAAWQCVILSLLRQGKKQNQISRDKNAFSLALLLGNNERVEETFKKETHINYSSVRRVCKTTFFPQCIVINLWAQLNKQKIQRLTRH